MASEQCRIGDGLSSYSRKRGGPRGPLTSSAWQELEMEMVHGLSIAKLRTSSALAET